LRVIARHHCCVLAPIETQPSPMPLTYRSRGKRLQLCDLSPLVVQEHDRCSTSSTQAPVEVGEVLQEPRRLPR
jgi:hypothetical protein